MSENSGNEESADGGDEERSGEEGGEEDESADEDKERSADGGSEGENEKEAGEVETNPNAGWAEVMAKILGKKTPEDKPCILLKNKQWDKLNAKERKEKLEKKKQVQLCAQA